MLKTLLMAVIVGVAIVACGSGSSPKQYLDTSAVIEALDGYNFTQENVLFFSLVMARDGRRYQVTPGPYTLEIYVYESDSLMRQGLEMQKELSATMGVGGIVRTEGNALLILSRAGGAPTPGESDMDQLIADLRN